MTWIKAPGSVFFNALFLAVMSQGVPGLRRCSCGRFLNLHARLDSLSGSIRPRGSKE